MAYTLANMIWKEQWQFEVLKSFENIDYSHILNFFESSFWSSEDEIQNH